MCGDFANVEVGRSIELWHQFFEQQVESLVALDQVGVEERVAVLEALDERVCGETGAATAESP